MTTALATQHQELAHESGGALASAQVQARMTRILEIQKAVMKDGVHFGQIPGTPKPTLYKAGAEKLLATFQIAASVASVEDLSTADEVRYRVKVHGVSQGTGVVLGEAVGECSSNEEKYRWRKPVCDEEFDDTPFDQRREVWKKYGGKPQKWKQVRTVPADVANTILQMATKRALIPMTRVVLACSDIFDQDLEDMPAELRESMLEQGGAAEAKPAMQQPQRRSQKPAAPSEVDANKALDAELAEAETPKPSANAVQIKSVVPRQGKTNDKPWTLFIVAFTDGREASTLDENVSRVAMDARDNKTWVIPTTEPGKKEGQFKLVELALAQV